MKLPKSIKRGNSWRMTLRYNSKRFTATRDTEQECIPWANPILLDLKLKKTKKPKSRNRRITQLEIEIIIDALKYEVGITPKLSSHYVAWSFLFAIETAMRRGEILAIRKKHIFSEYSHLEDTRNGESRDVPLIKSARELLSLIKHNDDRLIPISENAFRLQFERSKTKIWLSGLHFHDTRHEAITRLVNTKKVPVEILAQKLQDIK